MEHKPTDNNKGLFVPQDLWIYFLAIACGSYFLGIGVFRLSNAMPERFWTRFILGDAVLLFLGAISFIAAIVKIRDRVVRVSATLLALFGTNFLFLLSAPVSDTVKLIPAIGFTATLIVAFALILRRGIT